MLEVVSGFSLGCIFLIGVVISKTTWHLPVAKSFVALLFATAAYVLHPILPQPVQWISTSLLTAIPALFWLFCQFAFLERPKFHWFWLLLALYSALVPISFRLLPEFDAFYMLAKWVLFTLPSYSEYLLIAGGFWAIARHWSDDLVASRRRLRAIVISLAGIVVLLNVLALNFNLGDDLSQRVSVMVCLAAIGFQILSVPQGLLFGIQIETQESKNEKTSPKDDKLAQQLDQLKQLMSSGFYTKESLTIGQLATQLDTPEYIMRKLINEHLGFRNFNDFLNQWRVEDAKAQLISHPDKPIMNIALDLGYRTLSSFNRAFKERIQQTPTQFRLDHTQK